MTLRFKSILVSVTEGCHVGCAHCGFRGSARDRVTDVDALVDWVTQACEYGIPIVIFTGGEPFERFDALKEGVAAARQAGASSAVFTSSFWATTPEVARTALEQLTGLDHLYLSTDVYHQRRVPYEYVYNVIDAADALHIPTVTLCLTYATEKDREAVRSHYRQYGDRVDYSESRVIPTPFIPRAVANQDPLLAPTAENFDMRCWLETPIVNPNGDVVSCHSGKAGAHGDLTDTPYWLGNLHAMTFAEIMARAHRNIEYQYLRTHGPKGIAQLYDAYPELHGSVQRNGFSGPCDMCFWTLSSPEGKRLLSTHVRRSDVLTQINMRLALVFGEPPIQAAELADARGSR